MKLTRDELETKYRWLLGELHAGNEFSKDQLWKWIQETAMPKTKPSPTPTYIECGCCGHFHRLNFHGDCRQDNERFSWAELDEEYPQGWTEISLEEQMENENA